MIRNAKSIWIILSITVLLVTLYFYDAKPNSSAEEILLWGMLILSFPVSLLCALAIMTFNYILYQVMDVVITTSVISIVSIWLVYFALGYWQWFSLIPALYRYIKCKDS